VGNRFLNHTDLKKYIAQVGITNTQAAIIATLGFLVSNQISNAIRPSQIIMQMKDTNAEEGISEISRGSIHRNMSVPRLITADIT
jgi:hypothetical protein